MKTSPIEDIPRLFVTKQHSIQKQVDCKVDITEMYPRISWELVADPLGSAEHTLGATVLRFYSVCPETCRILEKCLPIEE